MAVHIENTNTIFIHFPKTGGTFVREILKKVSKSHRIKSKYHPSHTPMREIEMDRYKNSFAFVRDPLTWYESTFKFMLDYCVNRKGKFGVNENNPLKLLSKFASPSFQDYMDQVVDTCPGHYQEEFLNFIDFDRISFIGLQENLNHHLFYIFQQIGLKCPRPVIFNSPKHGQRIYPCEWKKGHKEVILKANSELIQRFYTL